MSDTLSFKSSTEFENAYKSLNAFQKQAVDRIYGPVMVVAGPGTGKTQLLAVRVCNILLQTDANPENIICLTYTDAGCTAMRKRLVKFMGAAAYKVNIFTFHSFCNSIIRDNAGYFGTYRELTNASDLEILEIITEIITELPLDHPLKRLTGDVNYDRNKYRSFFSNMKREGWTADFIRKKIEDYPEELMQNPDNLSSRGKTKGQLKSTVLGELKSYDFAYHACTLLESYNRKLLERGLIDFDDSINWVLNALKTNEDLLLSYQEKLQYILADEYQDTNGTQNELLFTLAVNEYIDEPNLFVVGDDDQSIFRFQGASMENLVHFKNKFNPEIIVLENNYRSVQSILDSATELITGNEDRLINQLPELSKNLVANKTTDVHKRGPELIKYRNVVHQQLGVVNKIKALHQGGVPYKEIAVLYRTHQEASDLLKYFMFNEIPVSVKNRVNVLSLPEIIRILELLKYLEEEYRALNSENGILFQVLHYNFWGLDPKEVGKVVLYATRNDDQIVWRDVFADVRKMRELGVENPEKIKSVMDVLETLIRDYSNFTPQVIFEKVLTETGLLNHILSSSDKLLRLQAINTLFTFLKNESDKNESLTMASWLSTIRKMEEMSISLPVNYLLSSDEGINFISAHGSKGLEFEHVFILNASTDKWAKAPGGNFRVKLPPNIFSTASETSIEDERRLFYVALTRAKNNVYISYCMSDETGQKEIEPAQFIYELGLPANEEVVTFSEEEITEFTSTLLRYHEGKLVLIDHDLIDQVLENMHMNATGVDKYLNCAVRFYFENILRVPKARTASLGFGQAIHTALENYYKKVYALPKPSWLPEQELQVFFQKAMKLFHSHFTEEEHKNLLFYGERVLKTYYEGTILTSTLAEGSKEEYKIKMHMDHVPVSGIIDRVDFYRDHVQIFDYKTGNRNLNKKEKFGPGIDEKTGGNYWRQGVFYKLLLDLEGKSTLPVRNIEFQFLENETSNKISVSATQEELDLVKQQFTYVYEKIKQHDFEEGCQKPECEWCQFVKNNMQVTFSTDYFEDELPEDDI